MTKPQKPNKKQTSRRNTSKIRGRYPRGSKKPGNDLLIFACHMVNVPKQSQVEYQKYSDRKKHSVETRKLHQAMGATSPTNTMRHTNIV
jgi:hypothetical protein